MMKLVSFSLFLCLILVSFSHAIDKDKLVLYLPLDEGKGTTAKDISQVGNDGKLEGQFSRSGKMDVTTADLFIGYDSRAGCNTRRSTQTIDEVIMWGRVLSEGEIKETMAENFFSVESADKLTTTWGKIKR